MARSSNGLNRSPIHLLHRAHQAAADVFAAEIGDSDLTPSQLAVLVTVARNEGLSQTDLTKRTSIDRSTITEVVKRMQRKGLLQRRRTKHDTRAYAVRLSAAVNRVVRAASNSYLSRLRVLARHAALRLRGLPRLLPKSGFDEVAVGPHDLASLGVYEYLHDVLAWQEPTQEMRGLWKIARSAGWIVPHERVCWISERPDVLRVNAQGRLHCPDGPALHYPDGWAAYAWKGVSVPAWMIEHPERITAATVADAFDPVLRNCMIEIMTPERFVRSGRVSRVSEDETGILWRKLWGYRGVTVGSWTAVEVANGTPEHDGSRKRYFLRVPSRMRSAREAVAWTYGLTDEQYAGLELRT
jgi:DNA-binding MarR family transcriptional regulator